MLSTVHRVCTGRRRVYPSPVSTAAQSWREREREGDWSVCFLVGGGFDWVLILLFDNLGEVWRSFIVSLEVRLEFWRGWNNNVSSMGGVLFFFFGGKWRRVVRLD